MRACRPRPTSERGVEVRGVVGRTAQLCPRLPTAGTPGPPSGTPSLGADSAGRADRGRAAVGVDRRSGLEGWRGDAAGFGGWLGEGVGWGGVSVRGRAAPSPPRLGRLLLTLRRELCVRTVASEGLAAAAPLLAAGAPVLGILSALDGDANRLISRCAHDAPHTRTHPEGSMLGLGAAVRKSRDFDGCWARAAALTPRGGCGDSDGRLGSDWDQRARCAAFRRRGRGPVQPRCFLPSNPVRTL